MRTSLFLISFVIFFYNLVGAHMNERLDGPISALFLSSLVDFRKIQALRLLYLFEYITYQDLEVGFVHFVWCPWHQLSYRFYWNEFLDEFIGGSINFD